MKKRVWWCYVTGTGLFMFGAACATGSSADLFDIAADGGLGAPVSDASVDGGANRPGIDAAADLDATSPPTDAASEAGPTGSTVTCAGYKYPETTTAAVNSCAGALEANCFGVHEFRVVGCYKAPPEVSPCPAGYKVAANMLIGLWAEAANVTRDGDESGLVCMHTGSTSNVGGSSASLTSACGFDQAKLTYCWKRGEGCGCREVQCSNATCCYSACNGARTGSATCSVSNYEAPVLCVK
jgi:hypothetical protein